jgi:benzoate membrane transport protein
MLAPRPSHNLNIAAVSGRYWGSVIANLLLIPVAFAAVPIASLVPVVPHTYVTVLAGLAILPSFQDSLVKALHSRLRLGATVAFVVAATPIAIAGITSAFWAVFAGLLVSLVAERSELLPHSQHQTKGPIPA